jgi:hypothetical protein
MDQSFASQRVFISPQAKNWTHIYSKKSLPDGLNPKFIGRSDPDPAWEWLPTRRISHPLKPILRRPTPNKSSTGLWALEIKNRRATGLEQAFHALRNISISPCFPKNESGKFRIPSLLISQNGYFTSRRCCCGLLEPLGSFGRTVAFAFDAFFSVMRIFGLFDFLNHLPILLTLNPSMSITFFMKRGLFKW